MPPFLGIGETLCLVVGPIGDNVIAEEVTVDAGDGDGGRQGVVGTCIIDYAGSIVGVVIRVPIIVRPPAIQGVDVVPAFRGRPVRMSNINDDPW